MTTAARITGLCVLIALAGGCGDVRGPAGSPAPASAAAEAAAESAFRSRRLPGMAVVVLQDAVTVVTRDYGHADVERRRAVDARTVFQLGSIGKQFLAALVVALAGDGTLSLDDPVSRERAGTGAAVSARAAPADAHVRHPRALSAARRARGCGTAADLARWTHLLSSSGILPSKHYALMTEATRLDAGRAVDYGFGLALVRPDGIRKISHGGAMRGYSAQAAHYPDRKTTVVVLTNRGDVRTDAIEREIARAVLGVPAPDRPARGDVLWHETPPPGPYRTTSLMA